MADTNLKKMLALIIILSAFFIIYSKSFENSEKFSMAIDNHKKRRLSSCENEDYYSLYNDSNCYYRYQFPNYYINTTSNGEELLYPCSSFKEFNCYECDPFSKSETGGICLSCLPEYEYDEINKKCIKCNKNETSIVVDDFYSCLYSEGLSSYIFYAFCDKFQTICNLNKIEKDTCFIDHLDLNRYLPVYNKDINSCVESFCPVEGFENGTCIVKNRSYKFKKMYIFWFNDKRVNFPSYNVDKSGLLLFVFNLNNQDNTINNFIDAIDERKLYFFNEEGRGYFDEINDKYEKNIMMNNTNYRAMSTSIAIKADDDTEYNFLLNFEFFEGNLELINLKTQEITISSLFNLKLMNSTDNFGATIFGYPNLFVYELNGENKYLIGYITQNQNNIRTLNLFIIGLISTPKKKNITIDSIKIYNEYHYNDDFYDSKLSCIQTESGNIIITYKKMDGIGYLVFDKNLILVDNIEDDVKLKPNAFLKRIFLSKEYSLLSYILEVDNNLKLFACPQNFLLNDIIQPLIITKKFKYEIEWDDFNQEENADGIALSETRVIFLSFKINYRYIKIYLVYYFDDYSQFLLTVFEIININEKIFLDSYSYFPLFKYKDLLGLRFENLGNRQGFILFGYFNSTDPEQIYNLKKNGLNYNLLLNKYLILQSNILEYEIRGIKIIETPNEKSGLYFISNITKRSIASNEIIDFNSEIHLYFSYNSNLLKGNYTLKFAGVLQEPNITTMIETSSYIEYNNHKETKEQFLQRYENIYSKKRNFNIIGKAALVQINVLNDIEVFCNEINDFSCLKYNNGTCRTCGEGKFYDVENANEITQKLLGENYYFDEKNNAYIKCHPRCKNCSNEYNENNNENMYCYECLNSTYFFLRDNNCLEKSYCEYNYYYDRDLDLHCINSLHYCPDNKPYESILTLECIEKCNFNELQNKCIPSKNNKAIYETFYNIAENINLNETLFHKKEKYIIKGNNISFIISTSEIEKDEVNKYNDHSTILLKNCEVTLRNNYSIPKEKPLLILKYETTNNYFMDVYYDIYNPLNFSQKLNLDLCKSDLNEIRVPVIFKKYELDLVNKVKEQGYNIFDLNDRFYHDICSKFIYNNSDISLSERKNLLDFNNKKLCMDSCNYINIDNKTLKSICDCNSNDNSNNSYYINKTLGEENSNDIIDNIKESIKLSKSSNIKVIKCTFLIFSLNLFIKNYGFYLIFLTNIINIIIILLSFLSKIEEKLKQFCIVVLSQMKILYNKPKIQNYSFVQNNVEIYNKNGDDKNMNIFVNKDRKKKRFSLNVIDKKLSKESDIININKNKLEVSSNNSNDRLNIINFQKEEKEIEELKLKDTNEYYLAMIIKYISYEERKKFLIDDEINSLPYKYALRIDNRDKGQYYWSLLKSKNRIISIFLNRKDFNIVYTKISLFIFSFNLSFTINALFFNDNEIYIINQEDNSYNINTEIARIIYSSIISISISFFVEYFTLTQKNIIKLRNIKPNNINKDLTTKLVKKLKIKFVIFSWINIIFNLIFLYYISAFCAVYSIIQNHMIKDSLISILLSNSYKLLLSLMPTIIRNFSLKKENNTRKFLYLMSRILALI